MISRVAHGWIKSVCNRPGFAREKVSDDWKVVVERMRRRPDIGSQFIRFAETLTPDRSFPKEESAITACRDNGVLNSWLTTVRNTPIDSSHWVELVRILRSWLEGMDKERANDGDPMTDRPEPRNVSARAKSIVLELQKEAMDNAVPVSALLRKALVVAKRLDNPEFEEWINTELSGYPAKAKFPEYRILKGEVKGMNFSGEWIPIAFLGRKDAEAATTRKCNKIVAELESMLNRKDSVTFMMPFPPDIEQKMCADAGGLTQIMLFVQPTSFVRILDAVRNIILNWTLKLEKEGVLGDATTFTASEMSAASNVPQNINNFFGNVQTAQIQQDSPQAVQIIAHDNVDVAAVTSLLNEIKNAVEKIHLPAAVNAEAISYITSAEVQVASPKPGSAIIKHCLAGLQRILGVAGDTIASKISEKIAAWLI